MSLSLVGVVGEVPPFRLLLSLPDVQPLPDLLPPLLPLLSFRSGGKGGRLSYRMDVGDVWSVNIWQGSDQFKYIP